LGHVPQATPISGQFVVRGQELPTAYVRAKFEDRRFTRLRGSQNFEIGSRQLRANLWSGGKNCPRPMCMPNLKIVAFSVCEILRGSQNFEIGSLRGHFVVRGQKLPTAYVHTKFEGRSFIRLRNIGTFRCAALIDPVTLTFDLLTLKSVW